MNVVKFTTKMFYFSPKTIFCYEKLLSHESLQIFTDILFRTILKMKFIWLIFMTPWFPRTLKCYTSITIHFQCKVFVSFLLNFSSSIFLYGNFWNLTKPIFFWPWPGAICQIPLSRDPCTFWKVAQLNFLILFTWSLIWNFQI